MKRPLVFIIAIGLAALACTTPTPTEIPWTPTSTTTPTTTATMTVAPVATAVVASSTPTQLPTYTVEASPTKIPTLELPTPNSTIWATPIGLFFVQYDIPAGWGWWNVTRDVCELEPNTTNMNIVESLNDAVGTGELHPGLQSIACPWGDF